MRESSSAIPQESICPCGYDWSPNCDQTYDKLRTNLQIYNVLNARLFQTTTEAEDDDVTSAVTESTMSLSTQDQRHLQNKLRELQMKKQHMDQLLDELQSLKIERELLNTGQ